MKGSKAMNERQNYLAEGFRNVDRQTDVEKFKTCLTAMESLSSFRTYKEETYQLLKPEEGGVFIDAGCGLGFDVERLAKKTSAKIVGLDTSYELLRDARHRAQDLGIANADLEFLRMPVSIALRMASSMEPGWIAPCSISNTPDGSSRKWRALFAREAGSFAPNPIGEASLSMTMTPALCGRSATSGRRALEIPSSAANFHA
jgi:SAM-dependent methyltransferase